MALMARAGLTSLKTDLSLGEAQRFGQTAAERFAAGAPAGNAPAYFAAGTQAIDQVLQMQGEMMALLERQLQDREQALQRERLLLVAMMALGLLALFLSR